MTFDPNGPPVENWWFSTYFWIVPLEVEDCVLPMIEPVSLAVWTKNFSKLFSIEIFTRFFYYTFYHTYTTPIPHLLYHTYTTLVSLAVSTKKISKPFSIEIFTRFFYYTFYHTFYHTLPHHTSPHQTSLINKSIIKTSLILFFLSLLSF